MSKEVDERIRHASNRTARDAARLIFKAGERKEDKLSKLQAEIDELRAQIENNRETLHMLKLCKGFRSLKTS